MGRPRFSSLFEQSRLCFLSNLLTVLFQFDVKPSIRGREAREIIFLVGDSCIAVSVDAAVKIRPRGRTAAKDPDREPMAIEVEVARWKHNEAEERLFWCDGDAGKLETQLREIAIAIVFAGERQLRKGHQFFYEMDCLTFQQEIEQEKKRCDEAEQRERIVQAEATGSPDCSRRWPPTSKPSRFDSTCGRSVTRRRQSRDGRLKATATLGRSGLAIAARLDPLMPGDDSELCTPKPSTLILAWAA